MEGLLRDFIRACHQFRHDGQPAERTIGLECLLTEGVDRRDAELVDFQKCLGDDRGALFLRVAQPEAVDARSVLQLVRMLLVMQGFQHFARAVGELPCGVVRERDKEDLPDAVHRSVEQETRNEMAQGIGLAGAGARLDDREPRRKLALNNVEFGH